MTGAAELGEATFGSVLAGSYLVGLQHFGCNSYPAPETAALR